MPTNSIDKIFNPREPVQNTGKGKSILGKDDFTKLLLTQLKYQDPLNPMESQEYASQLAHFSSLEQLENMNKKLETSIEANYQLASSVNNTMAANFIGKDVKLATDAVKYEGQNKIEIGYNLGGRARKATLSIYDSSGKLVKNIENLNGESGHHKLNWDFTDNTGKKVADGNYTFKVEAKASNGDDIVSSTFVVGTISALRFTPDGTKVLIGNMEYSLSEVTEITTSETDGD